MDGHATCHHAFYIFSVAKQQMSSIRGVQTHTNTHVHVCECVVIIEAPCPAALVFPVEMKVRVLFLMIPDREGTRGNRAAFFFFSLLVVAGAVAVVDVRNAPAGRTTTHTQKMYTTSVNTCTYSIHEQQTDG